MFSIISRLNTVSFLCKMITFLICMSVPVSYLSAYPPSKLMVAIESGDSPETIRCLISNGEDVNEVDSEMLRYVNPVLKYALDRGIDKESVEIIKILISAGANVNAVTYNRVYDRKVYGMMPLISYAVIYSSPEVVKILIDNGADVNYKLSKTPIDGHKSALTYARELGKEEIAKMLEKAGANLE